MPDADQPDDVEAAREGLRAEADRVREEAQRPTEPETFGASADRIRDDIRRQAEALGLDPDDTFYRPGPAEDVRVRTHHICLMLGNALRIAKAVNHKGQWTLMPLVEGGEPRAVPTIDALAHAAGEAMHAAQELLAEQRALNGWPQT